MDRMSSIEMALLNEKTEKAFYENESRRSRNPLAKAMFQNLARDEEEHLTRIRKLHERLVRDGAWPVDVPIEIAGTRIRETLLDVARKSGPDTDHDDDDRRAVTKAIAFEEKGEIFYRALSVSCDNPAEKRFFTFLSGIEREHRLSLADTLQYFEDPAGWLEAHEKIILDGA